MKNILHTFLFILILGGFSAGLIAGMDALTEKRIEENASYEWKAAILDHHDLSKNVTTYQETFENEFYSVGESDNERNLIYRHNTLDTYSFYFYGGGVWGEINGIITLESDGKTIVKITVLNQKETPGLGAFVADRNYLNKYVGKKFDPVLNLPAPTSGLDESVVVDQIAGATNTSRSFIIILNAFYKKMMGGDDLNPDFEFKKTILEHHDVRTDINTYIEDFNNLFVSFDNNPNEMERVYRHKSKGTYSYYFSGEGMWGEINGVITLENDGITILKITVLNHVETPGLGAIVATREYLDTYVGKKFDPKLYLSSAPGNHSNDVLVDEIADATTTSTLFLNILNSHHSRLINPSDINEDYAYKSIILEHHNITTNPSTYLSDLENNFTLLNENSEELDAVYIHNSSNTYSYYFYGEGRNGEITGVITLESDGKTIVKITVIDHVETAGLGAIVATREYLNNFVGKKFDPILHLTDPESGLSDDVMIDQIADSTVTSTKFLIILNTFYSERMESR